MGIRSCLMCYHCTKNQEIEDLGTCHNSTDLGVLKMCKPEEICIDTKVLIFWVEFQELSHLTLDLSQAEKKINVVANWENVQNEIYFTQNCRSCHFEWK